MRKEKLFLGYTIDFKRFYKKQRAVLSFMVGCCMSFASV